MAASKRSLLPPEYTQCEWLDLDRNGMELGWHGSNSFKIAFREKDMSATPSWPKTAHGFRTSAENRFFFGGIGNSLTYAAGCHFLYESNIGYQVNSWLTKEYSFDGSTLRMNINGNVNVFNVTVPFEVDENYNFIINGINNQNTYSFGHKVISRFDIEADNFAFKGVTCIRNSDLEPGMYDLVSRRFVIGTLGVGNIKHGPLKLPLGLTQSGEPYMYNGHGCVDVINNNTGGIFIYDLVTKSLTPYQMQE